MIGGSGGSGGNIILNAENIVGNGTILSNGKNGGDCIIDSENQVNKTAKYLILELISLILSIILLSIQINNDILERRKVKS